MAEPSPTPPPSPASTDPLIWHAFPDFITCQHDHLLRTMRRDTRTGDPDAGYRSSISRLNGHAFFECRQCAPATFFFAVFATLPDPHVTCYAIAEGSFREWQASPDSPVTNEMLYLLKRPDGTSWNPRFRPTR